MQIPSSGADLTFIVNLTRISMYLAVGYAALKILLPVNEFLSELRIARAEHRMLIDDLWTRHPEKKDDFYIAVDKERQDRDDRKRPKSLFASSGR